MDTAAEAEADKETIEQLKQLKEKFESAMNDDLNTSVALSVLFELVRLTNKLLEEDKTTRETLKAVDNLFSQLGAEVLGIVKEEYPAAAAGAKTVDELMNIVIEQRNDARKRRDYAAADSLRDKLEKMGIVLEDKPEGTQWRWK